MIQIDIPMPKNCGECPICNEYLMCGVPCNGRGWGENDVSGFSGSRPTWCPMKENERLPIKSIMDETYGVTGGNCPTCGNWIQSAHSFCGYCGQAVKWE